MMIKIMYLWCRAISRHAGDHSNSSAQAPQLLCTASPSVDVFRFALHKQQRNTTTTTFVTSNTNCSAYVPPFDLHDHQHVCQCVKIWDVRIILWNNGRFKIGIMWMNWNFSPLTQNIPQPELFWLLNPKLLIRLDTFQTIEASQRKIISFNICSMDICGKHFEYIWMENFFFFFVP